MELVEYLRVAALNVALDTQAARSAPEKSPGKPQ